jgi:hypothetical protein
VGAVVIGDVVVVIDMVLDPAIRSVDHLYRLCEG